MIDQYYISKVRAKGFKSVGNDWLQVEFSEGLNAIVGVNGAGKSILIHAISFACAAPLSALSARSLNDLRHIGGSEICEVQLTLRACKSRSKKRNRQQDEVLVHASITPDNTRVYRLNGRLTTGKELQSRLTHLGINLGNPFCLIRQEAVTELADSTDPLAISAVVSECSGLRSWLSQTTAAAVEFKNQVKDIKMCEDAVRQLEENVGKYRKDAVASAKVLTLEAEVAAAEVALARTLHSALLQAQRELSELETKHREVLKAHKEAMKREKLAQQKLTYLRDSAESTSAGADVMGEEELALSLRRAALAEELEIVAAQVAAHSAAEAAFQAAEAQFNSALQQLKSLEKGLYDSHAMSISAETVQRELSALQTELQHAQAAAAAAEGALQTSKRRVQSSHAQHKNAAKQLSSLLQTSEAAEMQLPESAESILTQLQALTAELQCKQRILAQTAESSAIRASIPEVLLPLHSLFHFKDPHAAPKYAVALEALAGRRLNIAVAPTTADAAKLVASGDAKGLRIWALDALSAPTARLHAFRQAAASFPEGEVILPLDLLSFDPGHEPAMVRAFGTHVIVSSAAVGRDVLELFGIPSIALDGSQISKGRLIGGYTPPGLQKQGPIHAKIKADAAQQALLAVQSELQSAAERAEKLQQQVTAVQQLQAAKSAVSAAVEGIERSEAECEASIKELREAQVHVQQLEAEVAARQALAAGAAGQALLHQQVSEAKINALNLESAMKKARSELEAASTAAGIAAEKEAVSAILRDKKKDLESQLESVDSSIKKSAYLKRQEVEQSASKHLEQLSKAQKELETACLAVQTAESLCASVESHKRTLESQIAEFAKMQDAVRVDCDELEDEGMQLEDLHGAVQEAVVKHAELKDQLRRWQQSSHADDALLNHQKAESAQKERDELIPRIATMRLALETTREGIQRLDPAITDYNEHIFNDTSACFADLITTFLPSVEVQVQVVGDGPVHLTGAQFCHRTSSSDEWISGLEALSGGQRTIVSLAYSTAARLAGCGRSGSSVLLADEVDAALDHYNQEQAARIMKMLCTDKLVSGKGNSIGKRKLLSQVICISHSPVFQKVCDTVVKLKMGDKGTELA